MIEIILNIQDIYYPKEIKEFRLDLEIGFDYYLKIKAGIPDDYKELFPLGKVLIYSSDDKEIILDHRFLIKDTIRFECKEIKTYKENLCCAALSYDFPEFKEDWGFITFIEIRKVNLDKVEKLKTKLEKKQEIYKIIDRYLKEDYIGALSDIGVFAEYIAFEIARKVIKKSKNFRSAVDHLCHYKASKKTKINYNYIGSLLWPLYYVRNQKSHAYPLIELNEEVSFTIFTVFSEIIRYLSENEINF